MTLLRKRISFAPLAAGALLALCADAPARFPAAPAAPIEAQPLTPVVIDAGHGGEDLGAVVNRVYEKNLALQFAHKLKARLQRNADLPVAMTREDDSYIPLDHRVVRSVDWSGGVFVSLHLNKIPNKKATGAIVYSYGPDRRKPWRKRSRPSIAPLPAPPREHAAESAQLARDFTRALRQDGFKVEPGKSDYYVLKNPSQPSVLIELGFMSNEEEGARLADPAYQDKMVESLARAIEDYATRRSLRGETASASRPATGL